MSTKNPAEFWYFRNVKHLCMLSRRHAELLAHELDFVLADWLEPTHYVTPLKEYIFQFSRHFAYWQFRRGTLLSKTILPLVPLLCRARHWRNAPAYTASSDHVLAVLRKKSDDGI